MSRTFPALVTAAVMTLAATVGARQDNPHATATVKEVMLALTIPASDAIFSAAFETPKDAQAWTDVRQSALTLAESGDLLMTGGRAKDNSTWLDMSRALVTQAQAALKAIDAKDADALARRASDVTCKTCHDRYARRSGDATAVHGEVKGTPCTRRRRISGFVYRTRSSQAPHRSDIISTRSSSSKMRAGQRSSCTRSSRSRSRPRTTGASDTWTRSIRRSPRSWRTFPRHDDYALSPDAYAEHISRIKRSVKIPIIGSLNGTSPESWLKFARIIEQAGADALELNLYEVVADLVTPATTVEATFAGIVAEVKRILRIPVAVKVLPYFTAFGDMARRLDRAGADALVLFNRFYQADIDITTMKATPRVVLSTNSELLLRLQWLAILHGRDPPGTCHHGRRLGARGWHQGNPGGRRRGADGVGGPSPRPDLSGHDARRA